MQPASPQTLNEALDRLWVQFLPQMEDRLAALEAARAALAAGTLSLEQRVAAHAAAHKLAGVLGTFGLTRGTVLAREAEVLFSDETDAGTAVVTRLAEIIPDLRTMIATRA